MAINIDYGFDFENCVYTCRSMAINLREGNKRIKKKMFIIY